VAKCRERLAVSKQKSHRFLKKLNKIKSKDQSYVEISNKFADLENLVDINRAWESIRENINISTNNSPGYYELKKLKPWFEERSSELLD
jgi:hypothetical protein